MPSRPTGPRHLGRSRHAKPAEPRVARDREEQRPRPSTERLSTERTSTERTSTERPSAERPAGTPRENDAPKERKLDRPGSDSQAAGSPTKASGGSQAADPPVTGDPRTPPPAHSTVLQRVRARRGGRRTTYTQPSWWVFLRRIATQAMSFGGPRLHRVVQAVLRAIVRAVGIWQGSLQVRVVSSTIVLGLAATSVIGVVLAEQVSGRLLEARRAQAFRDAGRATADFQADMTAYTGSRAELKAYVREGISRVQGTGGDSSVGVLLLRAPGSPPTDGLTGLGTVSATLVPEDLRQRVAESDKQQARSIELTTSGDQSAPGLIVGSQVTLPREAGLYELYFVMSLEPEQRSLDSIQRALIAGLVALVFVLGSIAWLVSRLVVNPVKEAAQVADRLSSGSLDERMSPHGRDEIARLARSFNEMADSLQEQIEAMEELSRLQRRFVSDVSHELRTPLTTIRMAAEVIDSDRETFAPAIARSSELLATQLDRFEALLADLLEISRFDAGAAALDAEAVDLGVVVRRVVELAQPLAEAQGAPLRTHGLDTPAIAEVEPRRIERIVRNLVANAIEHSEGKPVDIEVAADDRTAAILVADHGVGLRPDDAARVFDRFWRADAARTRTIGGTGLGLAISQEDAHLHGGTLRAWGRPGEGARFLLCLPTEQGQLPGRSPLPLAPLGEEDDEHWVVEDTSDEQTRILTEIDQLRPARRERYR